MIKFILFLLSFLANLIIIKIIPDEKLLGYINLYTIVGGCSALTFFLIYSSKPSANTVRKIGFGLILIYVFSVNFWSSFWVSAVLYPAFLIYIDYIITQSNLSKWLNLYRVAFIFSTIPILLTPERFEIIFEARVALMAAFLLFCAIKTKSLAALDINSKWSYILFNYSFYYGPLLLISNIALTPDGLRVWYIFSQGGLVVYLKYLDFALRKNHTISRKINFLILLPIVGAPIVPLYFFPSITGLAMYYLGLLGLVYSKRYIKFKYE
jgi:hypothetical protein